MISRTGFAVAAVAVLAACGGGHEFEPPDQEARVQEADALFAEVSFDTISWETEQARELEGNGVFAARCRNCHGPLGRGDTEYGRGRGLDVPSLVEPDWAMASMDSVRHRVFVGHAAGMPQWGVAGISLREIDAVSFYVLERLRPDVLEEGQQGG